MTLRIGGVPEHFNLPWLFADEVGAFAAAGLDIEWTAYPGGTGAMMAALEERTIDAATVLTEGAVTAICAGNPTRIISEWVQSPLLWGIFAAADSPATSVADLAHQRFAISRYGSGSELMAYVLAEREGWTLEDSHFVVVGGLPGAIEALPAGDAEIFLWERHMTQPHVDDGTFKRVDVVPTPWPSFVTVAHEDIISERGGQLDEAISIAGAHAARLHVAPDAVTAISLRYGLDHDTTSEWLATVEWGGASRPDEAMIDDVIATMHRLGRIETVRPAVDVLS